MSMICPDTYYEMTLKGKTASQVLTEIRALKREINRLKNAMEHPNYSPTMCPSEDVRVSCSRDYLDRAIEAYEELGGVYTLSKAEQKSKAFDEDIPHISKVEFAIGGFFNGYETRTYTVDGDMIRINTEHTLILKPSNIYEGTTPEITKEEFFDGFKDLHIGEWRANYDPSRFGYAVLDGTQWHLYIFFSNGRRPVKINGSNSYPYNFNRLIELLGIETWEDQDDDN